MLINDSNIEEKIITEVKRRTPDSHNIRIVNTQKKFLKGSLYTVAFDGKADLDTGVAPSFINRVYVYGNSIDVYGFDEHLLNIVGATHSRNFLEVFGDTKAISGVIALLMTVIVIVIVTVSVYRGSEIAIPQIVSSTWLVIVGFYFGKLGSKSD
jgi:hypothetical protein